ncbi:terpene synthase family protein [Coleofasciculus chthonoplastes]|uniref:terpene synthase family protein n=1 Tax=Coleofasciculus chthonoplastes TaxID=64178 RepID=UPI0032FB1BFE
MAIQLIGLPPRPKTRQFSEIKFKRTMTSSQPPFKLPDFYMPWPARVNPNVQGARIHCKEWAYRMGILESDEDAVWDEETFDAMDFAGFAAATHPDAPALELDLLSDWYVWGWFVDDYFPRAFEGGSSDIKEAKAYLTRLLSFMPTDLATPIPESQNPTEYALADLWPRTAPTMSVQWRQRFVEHIRVMAEANLRELFNTGNNQERILDPVEYITLRRQIGGVFWSADLVEHSLTVEIPPEIYDTRPIQVLNESYADSVGLRNDIISYQKDIDEGKVNNCVVVTEHFLETDLQKAVNFVNDIVNSRLNQFEYTMTVELEPMLNEYIVDGAARQRVMSYVKALRDWMAGDLEWEIRPGGRYLPAESKTESPLGGPKGLGTAAARIGLSPSMIGLRLRSFMSVPLEPEPFDLPEFYMPFSVRMSPLVDAVRKHAKEWAREMGFLGSLPDLRGKWGNWNEDKWDSAEFALFTALTTPDASLPKLELINDWHVWGWYMKDYFLEVFKRRRDLFGAKIFLSRLKEFMPIDHSVTLIPTNQVEWSLADLWERSTSAMSTEMQHDLAVSVQDYIDSHIWEITNLTLNRTADPVDYIEMRLSTAFTRISIILVIFAIDIERPSEIYLGPQMVALDKAFGDVTNTHNDVVAYPRRVEYEREINHAVVVAQRFLGVDVQETVNTLVRLITARLKQFEYIVDTEIPALLEELGLDADARKQVYDYIDGLQVWIAGCYEWHYNSNRYINTAPQGLSAVKGQPFGALTGLGTSATRLSSSSVGEPKTEPDAQPIVHNFLNSPTGLGTSAMQIAASLAETPQPETEAEPVAESLPSLPTGLGTSAMQIAASLAETPQPETEAEPEAETLPSLPVGLGTSAMQIAASLADTPEPETEAEPVAETLPSLPVGLGTSVMQISSLLGTGLTHKRHLW